MVISRAEHGAQWLDSALGALRDVGYFVLPDVLEPERVADLRHRMFEVRERIHEHVGQERLVRAGELGVLRIMCQFDATFLELLETPEIVQLVDATVGPTAILHLQNGFILPPTAAVEEDGAGTFQQSFHRDFPRYLNGYLASLNVLLTVDAFTEENGGTLVVPGSHQLPDRPTQSYMEQAAIAVDCPPGSLIVFDSTLWHAAGINRSGSDRVGINHQFTRSFLKQQIDYVRALGDAVVLGAPPRTQQLLGWYTRVVTSLDEYYCAPEDRLYRSGQG